MRNDKIIFSLCLFLVPLAAPAKAYIDPGTGSYIIQVVLGLLFAGVFVLKSYWQAFKALFTKAPAQVTESTEKQNEAKD